MILGAALLAVGLGAAPVTAASAVDSGDPVHVGAKVGYGGTGMWPVWYETPAAGEPDAWAYCIEHSVSSRSNTAAILADFNEFLGDNNFVDPAVQGKVLWVLANGYPAVSLADLEAAAGITGLTENDAIEATQYAIWRYTDLTWDATWNWETDNSRDLYWHLVNGANANPGLTPGDVKVTATITAPGGAQTSASLVGPFVVSTNQAAVSVSTPDFDIVDAAGNPIDTDAVVDGQEIYLDLRGASEAGSATVTVSAAAGPTGHIISVPVSGSTTPTASQHAQSLILVQASTSTAGGSADVTWTGEQAANPSIGTSLVDSADGDRVLGWNGGTVIDTVAYQNLIPGTEYTVIGELMNKADGSGTGITGSTTFTPAEASGSVDVTLVVPEGFAGEVLVAYEQLFEGTDTTGDPVATHEDIDDAAQTVTVEDAPVVETPVIGTSLVDAADQDHILTAKGGKLIDTVAYRNLVPGTEYTVTGELMNKADGSATGIKGSTTFTATEPNGAVDVEFTVPAGFGGEVLVAFEQLFEGAKATGEPVAEHTDINDAAQTVSASKPGTEKPTGPNNEHLPATGGTLPWIGAGLAGLLLVAGAALLVARSRQAASNVES